MKNFLIPATIIFMLFTGGCEQPSEKITDPPAVNENQNENNKPSENQSGKDDKIKSMDVKVYYPDEAGINLVAVDRKIKIANDSEKYVEAVRILTEQPGEKDLVAIFPKGAKINSVNLKNGTAFVDLDGGITKNFVGGSTGEEMLVNSVVDTLTEFKEVKQVRFLIDGQEIETLAGHMDLSEPIKRIE